MSRANAGAIRPASINQQSAWRERRVAEPEKVGEGVWAIPVPIPEGSLPATLAYLLEGADGSLHIIDPGWAGEEALASLEASLAQLEFTLDAIRTVVATHFHPDHIGLCGALRKRTGANVVVSSIERKVIEQETHSPAEYFLELTRQLQDWGVPDDRWEEIRSSFRRSSDIENLVPDREVNAGDRLEWPGHSLEVIITPGHTSGHICLVDREREFLYTGDHVLPEIFSGIGLGSLSNTSPLEDYLTSLDLLADFDSFQVLPGHEYRFFGLGARRQALFAHHVRRSRETKELIPILGDASIWEYASRLTWTAGWAGMRKFWLYSALRQTNMHRDFVKSGRALEWFRRFPSS
jgi:glyoxylase-like metal-dependent hydrolase (beta-lactamase superfamily II)